MNDSLSTPVRLMSEYNHWANQQFIEYFRNQKTEQIEAFVAGSFPSIRKTLMHIWDAQHIWYLRLFGTSPTRFLSDTWNGRFDELCAGLIKSSQDFVELVHNNDTAMLQEVVNYTTMAYGPQSSRRYEILLHVFNHSMYHRGQCVTMARALGLSDIPGTDLIKYLRIQGNP